MLLVEGQLQSPDCTLISGAFMPNIFGINEQILSKVIHSGLAEPLVDLLLIKN